MNIVRVAALSALAILPVAAWAAVGPVEGLIDSVLKCADIGDGTARLACYDGLIPGFRAAKAAPPPAPPPVATAAPPPADNRPWYDPDRIFGTSPQMQVRPEQFGAESLTPPKPPPPKPGEPAPPPMPEPLDSITAEVTQYAFDPYGKVILFLDNGQVWQQLPGDSYKVHFLKQSKNVVTISRGALGSYQFSLNGISMSVKVKRIK